MTITNIILSNGETLKNTFESEIRQFKRKSPQKEIASFSPLSSLESDSSVINLISKPLTTLLFRGGEQSADFYQTKLLSLESRFQSLADQIQNYQNPPARTTTQTIETDLFLPASASRITGAKLNLSGNDFSQPLSTILSEAETLETLNTNSANGFFTVNGEKININVSQNSLADVATQISEIDGVTATVENRILKLNSTDVLTLGARNDSSDLLAVMGFLGHYQTPLTLTQPQSLSARGQIGDSNTPLEGQTLTIPGLPPTGSFTLNGQTINFDSNADSLEDILKRINSSESGVMAEYNTLSDRVTLTATTTGPLSIEAADLSGYLLAQLGLSSGGRQEGRYASVTTVRTQTQKNIPTEPASTEDLLAQGQSLAQALNQKRTSISERVQSTLSQSMAALPERTLFENAPFTSLKSIGFSEQALDRNQFQAAIQSNPENTAQVLTAAGKVVRQISDQLDNLFSPALLADKQKNAQVVGVQTARMMEMNLNRQLLDGLKGFEPSFPSDKLIEII